MRRLTLFGVVILFLVSAFNVWAVSDDLTQHADQFPADTVIYVSTRIDANTIAALDGLIDKTREFFPTIPADVSLSSALESFTESQLNTPFKDIDAWLGDTVSIAVPADMLGSSGEFPGYVLVDLADSQAALDFFRAKVAESGLDMGFRDVDGKHVLDVFGTTLIIADDYLLLSSTELLDRTDLSSGSLLDNPVFHDALSRLPEDNYGAIAFMDYGAINRLNMASIEQEAPGLFNFMNTFISVDYGIGVGFSLLDEKNFIIDFTQTPNNLDYSQFGLEMAVPRPVNPDFVKHVPADASFLIHGANLGSSLKLGLNNIEAIGDYLLAQGGIGTLVNMPFMRPDEKAMLDTVDLGALAGGIRYVFSGITGMSLDDELTWMDGDAAMFLRILPNEKTIGLPDVAGLVESTESGAPASIIKNLGDALDASEVNYQHETVAGADALVFSQLSSESGLNDPALDVLIAGNNESLAFGQRTGVSDLLAGVDHSLFDDPTYQYASQYFLPDAQQVWYFGMSRIREFVDQDVRDYLGDGMSSRQMNDLEQLRALLAFIDSGSVTVVVAEDYAVSARLVLTLGDSAPQALSR